MSTPADKQSLQEEVARLEDELHNAQARLDSISVSGTNPTVSPRHNLATLPSHPLLLLSDSALPLGSFAFSSGLESYLAHHPSSAKTPSTLPHFLHLALHSLASTTVPYLLAAYRNPIELQSLDQTLDACTLCPVARRASVAQGKALLTLWERALRGEAKLSAAKEALGQFSIASRKVPSATTQGSDEEDPEELNGHFAPIWAAVTAAVGISLHESAYTYLLNHAKAVVSAAVRANVMGPYAAQGVLASSWLREEIQGLMNASWEVVVENAGQGVPMCDVWMGRHELLYSRIFNS